MLLDLSTADYHADVTGDERPSLSSSIASILCTRSPLHAWTAHPRLNPNWKRVDEAKYDCGTVAHSILLQGEHAVVVGEFENYRTSAAKEWRDAVRAVGGIPLLEAQWADLQDMVEAARFQIEAHDAAPPLFADGAPEQAITWEENGVLCRARLDWLRSDLRAIDDLKTTSRSAHPDSYARSLYGVGGDLQAAFYRRGVHATFFQKLPDPPEFRWIVVETEPPYALSVIRPGSDMLALADAKIDYAIDLWRRCLESNEWPGYPTAVAEAEMPAYEEASWMARLAREEVAA